VVRTHEMKLRLRGTVQASHPGYGVGVAFELKTKDEQANVNKLIDFGRVDHGTVLGQRSPEARRRSAPSSLIKFREFISFHVSH